NYSTRGLKLKLYQRILCLSYNQTESNLLCSNCPRRKSLVLMIRSDMLNLKLVLILTASVMAQAFVTAPESMSVRAKSYAPALMQGAYTPSAGSTERKAIMDALRAEMKRNDSRELIFVVQYLRVRKGWAWV